MKQTKPTRKLPIGEYVKPILSIVAVIAFVVGFAWVISKGVESQKEREARMERRCFTLVEKGTDYETSEWEIAEKRKLKAVYTLVWRSKRSGRRIVSRASRKAYYRFEVGKTYTFPIDPEMSEEFQLGSIY